MSNNNLSSDDFDKLLDDFIAAQLSDTEDTLADIHSEKTPSAKPSENIDVENSSEEYDDYEIDDESLAKDYSYYDYFQDFSSKEPSLAMEERRLYEAIINLLKSSIDCAKEADVDIERFTFEIDNIIPRFNPKRTQNLNENILYAWELLIKSQPERLANLPLNASDEQILNYAEKCTNKNLMMALISYVESLIELDACEIAYNLRKIKYKKYKIERKIYEEEIKRKEKIRLYIQALKEQNFPIDAELLVNNFFKTVRKDPEGAKKMLEVNPATFAPIQVEKLPNKFFGLIKAKPEDGKKVNKKLGKFLKNLKI